MPFERMAVPVCLKLPQNLSKEEETAVMQVLNKWCHNRFEMKSKSKIQPFSTVDLLHVVNKHSLTNLCINTIQKRWKIEDIGVKLISKRENVDMRVIENENLQNGFISCVLMEDMELFKEKMTELSNYGQTITNSEPYEPEKFELCLALHVDNDEIEVWYRAQFQQKLANDRAQIGLIDFAVSINVEMRNIRKFADKFTFGRISFDAKIRCENNSLDLLDRDQIRHFDVITAEHLKPIGQSYELQLDQSYFFEDENFEEEILQLED